MHILHPTSRPPDTYLTGALREIGHVVDVLPDLADAPVRLGAVDYDAVLLDGTEPDLEAIRTIASAARGALLLVIAD
ncbi:MAG: hypothetical protein JO157_09175, partial [Acetobacteraceae bacterium]|nr:hypothetical protein [Acetobacteraceae bacterium]